MQDMYNLLYIVCSKVPNKFHDITQLNENYSTGNSLNKKYYIVSNTITEILVRHGVIIIDNRN